MSGFEFEKYMLDILSKSRNLRNTIPEVSIGKGKKYIADIVTERNMGDKWEKLIIEIKYTSALTIDRVKMVIERFNAMNQTIADKSDIKFVLLFPGILTDKASSMLKKYKIEIWDIEYLSANFSEEISQTKHPVFQLLLTNKRMKNRSYEQSLIDKLRICKSGKNDWSKYQKLIGEILATLFCPQLQPPLSENSDALKVNRRDYILPNYCESGFWAFLRARYCADYIVVDAKNYSQKVTKKEVLQIANYLKLHGTGLFGMIISRKGIGESAQYTLREVWEIEKKLIIVLQDNDVEQMLIEKSLGREPENIIRQKIEDFRLLM